MTYLLGEFLKHRNFPPKLVVAASGKDPTLRYAPSQVCFANIVELYFRFSQ